MLYLDLYKQFAHIIFGQGRMKEKSKKQNNTNVLGSQSHGVGGLGVTEPNGSAEDMFTDEQPSKESILKGEGESVPALDTLNS